MSIFVDGEWTEEYTVEAHACDLGKRADVFLTEKLAGITRSNIQLMTENGSVKVNDGVCRKNRTVSDGDVFSVAVPPPKTSDVLPENIPIDVLYEDDDLLVVNKPKGMCVHPAPGNESGTLVNALMYRCGDSLSGINGVIRPGIVHRIDKDTSGLLIVAKNDRAHVALAEQISTHSFDRKYESVVYGKFTPEDGIIDRPIGRSEKDRKRMAVTDKGRNAKTHYSTLTSYTSRGGHILPHGIDALYRQNTSDTCSLCIKGTSCSR